MFLSCLHREIYLNNIHIIFETTKKHNHAKHKLEGLHRKNFGDHRRENNSDTDPEHA